MKIVLTKLAPAAVILLALPFLSANAAGKAFPKIVPALDGAPPEGFTIGKGHWAYNGSIDGSIYKVSLRNGVGETLVEAEPDFDVFAGDCYKLGMRVDPRSNYLFVAGCINGDAYVFDAGSGDEIKKYQLDDSGSSVINDIAVTQGAVYFTDFGQPFIYSLPLSRNGRIPEGEDAATAIPLTGDFGDGDNDFGAFANGIVATPDGKTLIIGHSGTSKIFRVDPATGHADEIIVDPPLAGFPTNFLDGIVLHDGVLFILSPDVSGAYPPVDQIQVVVLDEDMLTGNLVGAITDPDMDGVASGAMHGDSLYVNNARYFDFPGLPTEYWITKLNIYDVE
jgi:outer membrane protein assembly factor BamB